MKYQELAVFIILGISLIIFLVLLKIQIIRKVLSVLISGLLTFLLIYFYTLEIKSSLEKVIDNWFFINILFIIINTIVIFIILYNRTKGKDRFEYYKTIDYSDDIKNYEEENKEKLEKINELYRNGKSDYEIASEIKHLGLNSVGTGRINSYDDYLYYSSKVDPYSRPVETRVVHSNTRKYWVRSTFFVSIPVAIASICIPFPISAIMSGISFIIAVIFCFKRRT